MTKDKRQEKTDDGWPELLSVEEAARFLRLKRSTLDHYRCEAGPFIASMGRASSIPSPGS